MKSSVDVMNGNLSLLICLDESQHAEGKLYIDDGETYDYTKVSIILNKKLRLQDKYIMKYITFTYGMLSVMSENENYDTNSKIVKITILGVDRKYKKATLKMEKVRMRLGC